jgi:monovalent cation/proton antiporter MnhG/PhaG subunit
MTFKDVVVGILLVVGVGLQLLACLGLLTMRDTFARLHYVAPAGFGTVAIAAAVLVEESFSVIGDKAILVAAVILLTGPVLVHATARSARVRHHGEWTSRRPGEVERVRR